jgi:hypothetical protein
MLRTEKKYGIRVKGVSEENHKRALTVVDSNCGAKENKLGALH